MSTISQSEAKEPGMCLSVELIDLFSFVNNPFVK